MLDKNQLTPSAIKDFLNQENAVLLDIRTPEEFDIVNLSKVGEHIHIPMDTIESRLNELDKNKKYVIYCHHGVRSMHVQYFLLQNDFNQVYNLVGGIDAWSTEVDPELPRY